MAAIDFTFVKAPKIYFGAGKIKQLPGIIHQFGKNVLLVTGSASFRTSTYYHELIGMLHDLKITLYESAVLGEPSPRFIDKTVTAFKNKQIDVVVGIGGGSTMDAGKAISAMLLQEGSVTQFLEGMETKPHNGIKVPFIAVPTSSGTGSEATKNAVLSEVGEEGYKRSLRHDNFVPDIALLDPMLTCSCPADVTAACGLDALTQLLEAYISTGASPMTDALALSGLEHFKAGFLPAFLNGAAEITARQHMAYAALMSGIVLANAGLGVVHGFAAPIGGFFNISHGIACGTLLGAATKMNIEMLQEDAATQHRALEKYARAGVLLSGRPSTTVLEDCKLLINVIEEWIEVTKIPTLGQFGIKASDIPKIVAKTTNKNSPVILNAEQMAAILKSRL